MKTYPQLIAAPTGTQCGATYANEGHPEQCRCAATAMVRYSEGSDWIAQCDLHRPELPIYDGHVGFEGCQYQEEDGTSCGAQVVGEMNLKGSICELCQIHFDEVDSAAHAEQSEIERQDYLSSTRPIRGGRDPRVALG